MGSLHAGDHESAAGFLDRATRIAYDTHNLTQLGVAFQAMAARAAVVGRPVESARLWGAAGAFVPAWPLFRRRYYEELMVPAREALGPRWDEEVAAGATLAVDEALELALG